jgi:hypothetical protein
MRASKPAILAGSASADAFTTTDAHGRPSTTPGSATSPFASPSGTLMTAVTRPGVPGTTFGHSANLASTTPILLSDTAPSGISAEQMGAGFGDFAGEPLGGTWTLCAADGGTGDTGTLVSWSLDVDLAPAGTLTTAPPNNGSGGIFLNLEPQGQPLRLTGFDTPIAGSAGTPASIEVWIRPGDCAGFTDSPVGWTLSQTVSTLSAGSNDNAALTLAPIDIPAGGSTSVYLHRTTADSGIRYTGTSSVPPQTTWSNGDLILFSDISRTGALPFQGTSFSPRAFSGIVHYQAGGEEIFADGFE